jgi:outer membrane protein insertion porin family
MEGHILEVGARVGVIEHYGRSTQVPLFYRYFLGGPDSLRGFKYREVGPRNPPSSEPVGGSTLYYGTIEYSIPIIERLRVAFFYDIGNVLANAYDFDFSAYSDNWGIGIRLNIPHLGPLRLDYGIPIHHDQYNSSSGKFQFSAGFTRDF